MKIGLIIYGSLDTLTGGYLYDRKLVEYLRNHGDTVDIIPLPWRNYAAHLTENLHFRLPSDLDLLIQDELNHPSLLAANARPRLYPIVSLVHNLRSCERRPAWQNALYRYIERRYLKSVDGLIFNSETTRGAVRALIGDSKPYVIATPGGDRLGPCLTPARIRLRAAEPAPLRLLFLGNLTPLKGLHVVLQALSHLPPDICTLEVVGSLTTDQAYVRRVRRQINGLGLNQRVTLHGPLDNQPLIERLRNAHVLVLPSSYEGFGIAYLEGMAFGLPAIGTAAGAIPQLITDGENGYLITLGDSAALAGRLTALAMDHDLLARMSLNALKRFQSQPTWEESMENVRQFLLKMVSL